MEAMPAKRRRLSPPPSQQPLFDQLPDSMVEEILLRLPLSSVFASRCVSKRCLSLTTSPYFIQAFRRHNAPSNEDSPLGLFLQLPYSCNVREFSVCSGVPDIKFSGFSLTFLPGFRLDGNDPITVMGYCHDLILCCNRKCFQSDYFVVNPFTRQWVALPPTLRLHKHVLTGFVCDPASVPEARKGGKLRYRVVRMPNSLNSLTELNVEIFSSEDGQWNEFAVSMPEELTRLHCSLRAVACNGILYWKLAWSGVQLMRLDPFNSKKKEICVIQDPPDSFEAGLEKYKLGICQGKLRMCQVSWFGEEYSEPSHVKIWELEEGDGVAEWRLAKEVWLQEIGGSPNSYEQLRKAAIGCGYGSLWPLAFHPSKGDTIYFGCNSRMMNKIICYDLKRKRLDIVGDCPLEESLGGVEAFPFQLPWWPTPVPALPKLTIFKHIHVM